MGHLDAAAGVAGLIKTALALKHGVLPPTLHYKSPNPQYRFYRFALFREWSGSRNGRLEWSPAELE